VLLLAVGAVEMSPRRVLVFALATQGLLIVIAAGASRVMRLSPVWGRPMRDFAIGLVAAALLAAANYWLLARAPDSWIVKGIRAVYDEMLIPLFARLDRLGIVVIGAAAGLGEEWLFRGVLQPVLGFWLTSLLFGLAHVGGIRMLPFGVWATGMGLVMGGLAVATGGLIAPIVAHGVYDMLALEYIRRGERGE
jgi:membrane protease YdiL (CAAX protease family)